MVSATNRLLDDADSKDEVDLMRDLAVPLPLLVIAEMMGVQEDDRPYIRSLAEKLLYNNRGEPDRYRTLMEGVTGDQPGCSTTWRLCLTSEKSTQGTISSRC